MKYIYMIVYSFSIYSNFSQKEFFTLKELERLCQKEKGITSMSVKEVLQSLVDDSLVDTEKIGTSVYFWALPSKASQNVTIYCIDIIYIR